MLNFSKSLKKNKKFLSKSTMNYNPTGSRQGILYGLCKMCKSIVDGVPPFRPIMSVTETTTYKLAKLFVPSLEQQAHNQYAIKIRFRFVKNLDGVAMGYTPRDNFR